MIRLIQRRLIIPRGDTGSFTVPLVGAAYTGDLAIFSIFDPLTKTTVFEKYIPLQEEMDKINVVLIHGDTVNIEPRKYLWDIKIYHGPVYDEENSLIGAREINSYYAAFSLPVCEIREVAQDV